MRHRKAGKKLGRNPAHRKALFRNLVTALFKFEQIETTDAKAKAIRPIAEKLITLAKRGDLHSRRQVLSYVTEKAIAHKLFEEIKNRFMNRQGGYIRIIKKSVRKGDGAPVSIVQLIPADDMKKSTKKTETQPVAKEMASETSSDSSKAEEPEKETEQSNNSEEDK